MNTKVLNKCIEALKAENPDLSYIKGMLETLLDMCEALTPSYSPAPSTEATYVKTPTAAEIPTDEEGSGILNAYLSGTPAVL